MAVCDGVASVWSIGPGLLLLSPARHLSNKVWPIHLPVCAAPKFYEATLSFPPTPYFIFLSVHSQRKKNPHANSLHTYGGFYLPYIYHSG